MQKSIFGNISLTIILLVCFNLISHVSVATGKMEPGGSSKLILLNKPEIGGIAEIKLIYYGPAGEITCFLTDGLELINDKGYEVKEFSGGNPFDSYTAEDGERVSLWTGQMLEGTKEIIFKVRIPDGKRYFIKAYPSAFEIDLGEPEPPPSDISSNLVARKEKKKQELIAAGEYSHTRQQEEELKKDKLPFKMEVRHLLEDETYKKETSKQNPKDIKIPYRLLVYSKQDSSQVNISYVLPDELRLYDEDKYQVTYLKDGLRQIDIWQGQMEQGQTKAFYFDIYPTVKLQDTYTSEEERLRKLFILLSAKIEVKDANGIDIIQTEEHRIFRDLWFIDKNGRKEIRLY